MMNESSKRHSKLLPLIFTLNCSSKTSVINLDERKIQTQDWFSDFGIKIHITFTAIKALFSDNFTKGLMTGKFRVHLVFENVENSVFTVG